MSIDLTIPGNTGDIRATATWLQQLSDAVEENDYYVLANLSDSQMFWTGQSGDAYRSALGKLTTATGPVPSFAEDLAEVMNAYAARLERGRETFASYSSQAYNRGLVVVGLTVRAPTTTINYCPTESSPPEDLLEWNRYIAAYQDYNVVADAVGTWWGELELWVAENFGPLAARIQDLQSVLEFYTALHEAEGPLIDAALEAAGERSSRDYAEWRQLAEQAQDDYDLFKSDLRSGHPGIQSAAEKVDFKGLKKTINALNDAVDVASKYSKVIPVVGGVIDVIDAGVELATGGSPSSVAVDLIGGGVGGAVAGGLVAGGPVGWVALAVAGGGYVGSQAATWLWEAVVPLESREAIDAGLQGEDILFAEENLYLPPVPQPSGAPPEA